MRREDDLHGFCFVYFIIWYFGILFAILDFEIVSHIDLLFSLLVSEYFIPISLKERWIWSNRNRPFTDSFIHEAGKVFLF